MKEEIELIIDHIPNILSQGNIHLENTILPVITGVSGVFVGVILSHKTSKMKLKKAMEFANITDIDISPELRKGCRKVDVNRLMNMYLGEAIMEFAIKVINKIPKEELKIFYNNINNVKTYSLDEKKDLLEELSKGVNADIRGTYESVKNEIIVPSKSVIYHELFHMASTSNDGDTTYSGFSQSKVEDNEYLSIGLGITEGYTEILTDRYFGDRRDNYGAYVYEQFVASQIEELVGKDTMRKLYLNADLVGLKMELNQYGTDTDILDCISSLDYLCIQRRADKKSLMDINKFLLKSKYIKMREDIEKGLITDENAKHELANYGKVLGEKILTRYNDFDSKKVEDILSEAYYYAISNNKVKGKNAKR